MKIRNRVIPCLLISGIGLVKTKSFKDPVYLGDPINAVRIFNDKEADEIVVLDIDASRCGTEPNYKLIEEIAGEAFMPMSYGGGIKTIEQIRSLIRLGVEKVVINSAVIESYDLIRQAADLFGSQAIVGCLDFKKTIFGGYRLVAKSATTEVKRKWQDHIKLLVEAGVGEIFINNVDRDGQMTGYDLSLLKLVTDTVNVPVVACGGAGNIDDLKHAIIDGGVSAVAAGSMFVFHGKHRGVLISYIKPNELDGI